MTTAGGPPATPAHPVHHVEEVMGTVVTIDVYTTRPVTADQLRDLHERLSRAVAVLHRADEVFSTWQPDSPVSRLRRGEISLAQAPPEVTEVAERCATAREVSGGWFDPWAMPGGFDPTGYVKGWAAQNALAEFPEPAVSSSSESAEFPTAARESAEFPAAARESAEFPAAAVCGVIINAAGDIASSGGMGRGQPFRIGIVDPAAPRRLAEIAELTGAVATSGTYERGSHLIDPHSGRPATLAASASVTGPDLGLADALATALAIAGEQGLALIEPLTGYEALLIGYDGSKRWTDGFPFAQRTPPRLAHPGT